MPSIHVDLETGEWRPGSAKYGATAIHDGKEILQSKILSDRRQEGGGLALLSKVSPPPGKLVKIVAVARSDEHVFNLVGGRSTKSGEPVRAAADYTLNPEGQVHSVLIGAETLCLVIYRGEPDENISFEIVDATAGVRRVPLTGDPILTVALERDPHAEAAISAGLAAYNAERFRPADTATLDILVRADNTGEPVGGLLGHTSFGLFFLDLFYLPEPLRARGLGGRIIALAENEARRRGCTAAFVYTVTFQAPGFYERHGYRRFGEIGAPPDGATRIFLTKSLSGNAVSGG
jgi:GNAT superfamily N-acetyltransferase